MKLENLHIGMKVYRYSSSGKSVVVIIDNRFDEKGCIKVRRIDDEFSKNYITVPCHPKQLRKIK